ncbi:polysaccharide deacetylase family protein [bacterium]|nr:polysaccharide deacetylase family protein [bacterium]
MLTIVMYHYIRNLKNSSYPRIKGLQLEDFDGQLDYLQRHYCFVELEQVIAASRNRVELPPNACLLTFDDGFSDHYEYVFPRLKERGIKGAFYPPVKPVLENTVLDVHKIHFILASAENPGGLIKDIFELLTPHRQEIDLPNDDELYRLNAGKSRFDPPEIIFVKRILQVGLPEWLRNTLVAELFNRHVDRDENEFARELYLSSEQLKEMVRAGMAIGVHGYSHRWFNSLTVEEQTTELDLSLSFLNDLYGKRPEDWTVCYPYGGYNEDTLRLLEERNCALGLTARVALVENYSTPLLLPRLDTNDLPKNGAARANEWTLRLR